MTIKPAKPNRLIVAVLILGTACLLEQTFEPGSIAAPPTPSFTSSPRAVESPTPAETETTGAPKPIARIDTIVVNQNQLPTVAITQAKIISVSGEIRAATASAELSSGDEIETGADTYVTVVFLEQESENENEIIVYPETRITLGSGWTWWGRALYRVRGWFGAGSDNVAGASGGTEYLVTVCKDNIKSISCQDNSGSNGTDLAVLDDAVKTLTYDVAIGPGASIDQPTEATRTISVGSLRPQCRVRHNYALEVSNMPWLDFLPGSASPAGRRAFNFRRRRQTTFVPRLVLRPGRPDPRPGVYKGDIKIKCLDCLNADPACGFDPAGSDSMVPIIVKIAGHTNVDKRQRLEVSRGQNNQPSPRTIEKDEATVLVNKTSDVILAGQQPTVAPKVLPNYTDDERKDAFRRARTAALVEDQAEGYQVLGKVNLDWGKGAKALQAFDKVPDSSREKQTAEFSANVAEAYRLTNQLDKAEAEVKTASAKLGANPSAKARVMTIQGNIYDDLAHDAIKKYEQSKDELHLRKFDFYSDQAQQSYILAIKDGGLRPQAQAVPLKNLGESYGFQMETLVRQKADVQKISLANQKALEAYTTAVELNPADYQARNGKAFALYQQAKRAATDSERTRLAQQARDDFNQAIAVKPADSQALAGRSLANDELGQKVQAKRDMQSAIRQNVMALPGEVQVPDVTGKSKAVATREIVGLKLEPVFEGKGDIVIEQKPLRGAKVKPGTRVTLRLN